MMIVEHWREDRVRTPLFGGPAARTGVKVRSRSMAEPRAEVSAVELASLIRDVANEDRQAFARLFGHFAPRIKSMMMRGGMPAARAEDLAQDTMLAVWRKAHLYDPGAGSAAAWIYTIARNRRIDLARTALRSASESAAQEVEQIDDEPLPDALVASAQFAVRVRAALQKLNPEQQQVVRLAFFDSQSHSEIAETLNIPLGTVKSRIRLAFGRLRELLGDLQ